MKTKNPMNPMKNFSTFGRVLNVLAFKLNIMKKWMLFLTLILMMSFSSCDKLQKEKTPEAAMADSTNPCPCDCPPTRSAAEPTCKYCVDGDDHSLSLRKVRRYIEDFRIRFSGKLKNSGGYWTLYDYPSFTSKEKSKLAVETLVFYPCVDKNGLFKDVAYLAAETKDCNNQSANCTTAVETPGTSLVRPPDNCFFGFIQEEDLMTDSSFTKYLNIKENYTPIPAALRNVTEASDELATERENFASKFSDYYPDPVFVYGKGNTLSVLRTLPGAVGIRYYFGYDAEQETNKIRIIFCAVNAEGKIIVPNGNWDMAFRESSRPRRP
jgi:hypothetical protein